MNQAVLELLRAGEAHDHLITPSQAYLALIGNFAPSSLSLPWEHRDLRHRLSTLRYRFEESGQPVPESQRQASLDELGRQVAGVLSQVTGLPQTLAAAHSGQDLTHLRLVLTGNELAMVPWEASLAPAALGLSEQALLLQQAMPICLTREVRGASRRTVAWSQVPRVLFIVSDPEEFPPGTAEAHLLALRAALREWSPPPAPGTPGREVTVLVGPDVPTIREACAGTPFTHVHLLAHGDQVAGPERTWGIRLRAPGATRQFEVVTGERLASALGAGRVDAQGRHLLLVSLATCDSGNVASMVVPGGSVAHELHRAGVPWVIASQLPLTIQGSVAVAASFLPRIFRGQDPREALVATRMDLRSRFADTHDWMSLVAYASIPSDFDAQVARQRANYERHRRNRIYAQLDRLWQRAHPAKKGKAEPIGPEALTEILAALKSVRNAHIEGKGRLPTSDEPQDRASRAVWQGNLGSVLKRVAQVEHMLGREDEARNTLRDALRACKDGMDEAAGDHWVTCQRLVLATVLGHRDAKKKLLDDAWATAGLALYTEDADQQMWAYTTQLEIAICGLVIDGAHPDRTRIWTERAEAAMQEFIDRSEPDELAHLIMLLQLQRYVHWWVQPAWAPLVASLAARLQAREGRPAPPSKKAS